MKYALLCVSCQARGHFPPDTPTDLPTDPAAAAGRLPAKCPPGKSHADLPSRPNFQTQISFDVKKVTSFEDASAPFILYNSARVTSLVRKFEAR